MNPAEFIELVQNSRSDVASFVMNYMTLLFAFLTMTYFVGKKLTFGETLLISVMYSLLAIYLILTVLITYGVVITLISDFHLQFPVEASKHYRASGTVVRAVTTSILMTTWLISLSFLFTTRRRSNASSAQS